jgi:uncharacterized membrane protein
MALTVRESNAGHSWIARPNRALSSRQAVGLLFGAAVATLPIAFIFSLVGAWPVLPFAGLEIAALWLALRHLHRHAADEERIEVESGTIAIHRQHAGIRTTHRFSRYWAQLRIEKPPDCPGWRLFLRSHGRELEIGQLLTDTQKRTLAQELKTQLGAQQK